MYAADKQLIFVAEVSVDGRSADIGAVQDFLNGDGVITLLVDEGNERLAQEALCLLNSPILDLFFLHHLNPSLRKRYRTKHAILSATAHVGRHCSSTLCPPTPP